MKKRGDLQISKAIIPAHAAPGGGKAMGDGK
jgi:hypothetical protein